jgi:hypothetical protein
MLAGLVTTRQWWAAARRHVLLVAAARDMLGGRAAERPRAWLCLQATPCRTLRKSCLVSSSLLQALAAKLLLSLGHPAVHITLASVLSITSTVCKRQEWLASSNVAGLIKELLQAPAHKQRALIEHHYTPDCRLTHALVGRQHGPSG